MKQTLILDSTQIDAFLTCPRLWHYGHKLRLTQRDDGDTKVAMQMGTYGHKLLEIFYRTRAEGSSLSVALEQAMAFDPDTESINCQNCNLVQEEHSDPDGCQEFKPKPYPLDKPNRELVKKQIRMYVLVYGPSDYIINDPESIELGFSHKLYEDEDYLFILEGRIDLLEPVLNVTKLAYADHKFQMRKHNLYKKSIQFKNYGLVTRATLAQVNYVRFTKEVNKDTFSRELISFTPIEHEAWESRLIGIYKTIAKVIRESNENPLYWQTMPSNPNWASCSGKFGYPCDYVSLCEETNPNVALVKIDSSFRRREEWRPW